MSWGTVPCAGPARLAPLHLLADDLQLQAAHAQWEAVAPSGVCCSERLPFVVRFGTKVKLFP